MSKNKQVALVTDLKVVDSPQAGIGVARSLKKAGFSIIGVDDTPLVIDSKDLFDKVLCWDELRNLNFDSLVKKISNLKDIYDLKYIFPCYDETTVLFSFIKDKLDYLDIKLVAPPLKTFKQLRKSNLVNLINRGNKNFKTPEKQHCRDMNSAKKFANKLGYPVMCKGLTKGAYISKNESELEQNISKISDIWNNGEINCLVEEYIKGKYYNAVVGIRDNKIISYVEMQKIGLDQNGATWFGKIKKSTNLLALSKNLILKLNFETAIIEIEAIKKDETYYIYEINPRTPAWIYSSTLLGLNIPFSVTQDIVNKEIKMINKEGFFGRATKHFIRFDIKDYENNIGYYSKGAAYKTKDLKYPSELLLNL